MAIVAEYDASTSRRLYRPSLSHEDAVALIVKGRGTHFDPDVVDAFVKVSGVFRELAASDH
jgi:putative two-component system response regulator